MIERLEIARIGRRGDGIAEAPAGPLYVPYTLPNETVEVEPLLPVFVAVSDWVVLGQ